MHAKRVQLVVPESACGKTDACGRRVGQEALCWYVGAAEALGLGVRGGIQGGLGGGSLGQPNRP